MSEQTLTPKTPLSSLAEKANASGEWWKEGALDKRNEMELPTRVIVALENAGINTLEELKAAGPAKLRRIEHIGKLGFQQIVDLLRAVDRQNGGGA